MNVRELQSLSADVERELLENILPFWVSRSPDPGGSGFHGRISHDNRIDPDAPRSAVLNTRLLWTFSAAWNSLGPGLSGEYPEFAERAFTYLREHFLDADSGGVYWLVGPTGEPVSTRKQIYAQAFAVYALAEFYRASGESEAREIAGSIIRRIEGASADPVYGGYLEAFSRDWGPLEDLRLSPRDANEKKSMNTHLHVLEAYSSVCRIFPGSGLEGRLAELIRVFLDRIIDPDSGHQRLFFTEAWTVKSQTVSYGHDVECSWLLHEAAETLSIDALCGEVERTVLRMVQAVLDEGLAVDGGLIYEREPDGRLDRNLHWWPQAEALVGFLNAFELTRRPAYLEAVLGLWRFVQDRLVNREHGEWYWSVSPDGEPNLAGDKVGPWKGPYHNTRACLELLRRIDRLVAAGQAADQ